SQATSEIDFTKKEMDALISQIVNDPITANFGFANRLQKIKEYNQTYHQTFDVLENKVQLRGFKGTGIEGEMRRYAHDLEQISSFVENEEVFDNLVLQLRRHEKDFIIRKDPNYGTKLHQTATILTNTIPDSLANQTMLISLVNKYVKQFDKLVRVEKEIGLEKADGLRGQLRTQIQDTGKEIDKINTVVSKHTDNLIEQAQLVVLASILVMLIVAAVLAYYFSRRVSAPIEKLDRITQSVVKGLRNQEELLDHIHSNDEVGNLAKNFKVMITKLKSSMAETEERNTQLEEFAREEAKRNWAAEGLSIFGEILRKNNDNLERQSYEIIATLVRYTDSHQGAIFIVNDEQSEPALDLKAAYAYERQKFLKRSVAYGEGLVGTVWREEDTLLITDIPEDYTNITSGLGKAKPKCILLVPIKDDNNIEGVIELISFKDYQPYEIEFIERLSVRIATTVAAVKANEQNAKLLAASKEFAEKLKLKEAELKRQIDHYESWVKQFEKKLDAVAEEAHVYQTIINRVYEGIILTNEKFIITKVNNHILERFGYDREELEGKMVDVFIETDYANIIDLKERKFQFSYKSF
ncbi:MAG: GAF domain-containing protein, partial [Bacteroidota bacterium]